MALAIIDSDGVEQLSLRAVARRLGVSHQAPYKHFSSRDHLLAEIVARAFTAFATHLDDRRKHADPNADLRSMGTAYLGYAAAHPLSYRLMFGTPLPDPKQHPEMMRSAQHAFELLHDCLTRIHRGKGKRAPEKGAMLDALFVWSNMHGLASITQSHALATLDLAPSVLAAVPAHIMLRLGTAIDEI